MHGPRWRGRLPRLIFGVVLIAISVLALAAPLTAGTWSLQFLSLFPLAVGISDLYTTIKDPRLRGHPGNYTTGFLAIALALLLYLSPALIVTGMIVLLLVFLAVDGVWKVGQALFARSVAGSRTVDVLNGAASLGLALIGWLLWRNVGVDTAIGVAIAGYTAAAGWRMLVAPLPAPEAADLVAADAEGLHPDPALGLGRQRLFATITARRAENSGLIWQTELYWLLVVAFALFATHLARMPTTDTWLGLISPLIAIFGDIFMAVALGAVIVLPLRLLWRRLTRPLERKVWRLRLSGEDARMEPWLRRLIDAWTDARFGFSALLKGARHSLTTAGALVTRLGLPLAILFVAVNPIWGFSWYFNTESWASAFYQKVTELRVDTWRAAMVDAVTQAYDGDSADLFRQKPAGIDNGDFSFIVIGDPGEGDPSQWSLVNQYLALGRRDDVKFLVISSDVIYPAGAMADYETNFYLPFKGFKKPIYAIPGNHDWFDALEGFNANFLEPRAARAALAARAATDLHLTATDKERIDRLLAQAKRLRDLYGIRDRAPARSVF